MPITVIATRPSFARIKAGEVYESDLFTASELADLALVWRVRYGCIDDVGPKLGIGLVQFVSKREVSR